MKKRKLVLAAACALLPVMAAASCGSAFCVVNTNWTSESAMVEAGSSFDLRYEYINQDRPRAQTTDVAVGQIRHHHDEVSTVNRNVLATYSRNFGSGWGMTIVAPLVDRNHLHVHNHGGGRIMEQWNFTELGDARVTARYQLASVGDPLKPATSGFVFGIKLPTGRIGVTGAAGAVAERSLQPGTGTTDLIVGAFHHQALPELNSTWFVQAQYQHALNKRDEYKPGAQLGVDLGFRYGVTDKLAALAQLNAVVKWRDSGANAEPDDSGSRSLFLSPGLAYTLTDKTQVYGYYQHPLYQYVNGVQLTARRAITVGVVSRF